MENRINKLFTHKKENILSVYFTAGYPNIDDTAEIIEMLALKGADMIEIGVPFSDPVADGPVIQESSHKALENGMNLKLLFSQLKHIRQITQIPLIIMSYLNPVLHYGFEEFCKTCSEVGIDGMIIPDLPLSEYIGEYKETAGKYGLENILMITPETSPQRIKLADSYTNGFIYMVSSASITGEQNSFSESKENYFRRIAQMNLKNPTLTGFGISNRDTYESACRYSNGVIVGSAFIKSLRDTPGIREAVENLFNKLGLKIRE